MSEYAIKGSLSHSIRRRLGPLLIRLGVRVLGVRVGLRFNARDFDSIPEAVGVATRSGGGVVFLPRGVYECKGPVSVPDGVKVVGEER